MLKKLEKKKEREEEGKLQKIDKQHSFVFSPFFNRDLRSRETALSLSLSLSLNYNSCETIKRWKSKRVEREWNMMVVVVVEHGGSGGSGGGKVEENVSVRKPTFGDVGFV